MTHATTGFLVVAAGNEDKSQAGVFFVELAGQEVRQAILLRYAAQRQTVAAQAPIRLG